MNSLSFNRVSAMEKILSVLSYFTMGIVGFIWVLLAHFLKRKLKPFLMYNIAQSMLISVFFALIWHITGFILLIVSKINFLDFISALINLFFSYKLIFIANGHISLSLIQLFVFLLLLYISFGICLGRIFYIPFLSGIMNKIMKNYE